MQLSLIGINNQTAPLDIREKVTISAERLSDSLALLRTYVPHGVILSTCNRTEIYTLLDGDENKTTDSVLDFLKVALEIPVAEISGYVYDLRGLDAVKHLFRVASGVESLIIGEFEILGQTRQALEAAEKTKMVNLPLRQVFNCALRTGRMVREQTGISRNALSVSSVAIDLASKVTGDLKKCRLLVVGAGEAGKLVAKVAREMGTSQIVIASRTGDKARALASILQGTAADLDNLDVELNNASIVVTCTSAPERIFDFSRVEEIMKNRSHLPLVIIDIAFPRNVDPKVGGIPNVFLYNMDDLNGIAEANRKQRENEINNAERIITGEADKFAGWWHDLETRPLVTALMAQAEAMRSSQLNKTVKKLPPLSDEQYESLEVMTKSIINRILNDPIQYLKTTRNSEDIELIKELFKLNPENLK